MLTIRRSKRIKLKEQGENVGGREKAAPPTEGSAPAAKRIASKLSKNQKDPPIPTLQSKKRNKSTAGQQSNKDNSRIDSNTIRISPSDDEESVEAIITDGTVDEVIVADSKDGTQVDEQKISDDVLVYPLKDGNGRILSEAEIGAVSEDLFDGIEFISLPGNTGEASLEHKCGSNFVTIKQRDFDRLVVRGS